MEMETGLRMHRRTLCTLYAWKTPAHTLLLSTLWDTIPAHGRFWYPLEPWIPIGTFTECRILPARQSPPVGQARLRSWVRPGSAPADDYDGWADFAAGPDAFGQESPVGFGSVSVFSPRATPKFLHPVI